MRPGLAERLEALQRGMDLEERLAADPVAFPRRYSDKADVEVAAVIASSLAYGRVAGFRVALEQVFAWLDAQGGPAAAVAAAAPGRAVPLQGLVYRFTRGRDIALLVAALRRVIEAHGTVEGAVPRGADGGAAAEALVGALVQAAAEEAPAYGVVGELPRGLRYLLPRPSGGSTCKRWMMALRWLVRPADGIDLGIWTRVQPRDLVIPVDTHVHRVAGFLGLTRRRTATWATAQEITASLRTLDPTDPVRYDFALAHLGISGACRGARHTTVCPGCPLDPVCTAPGG